MFLFPDASKRVFQEIQSVTFGARLPRVTDRPRLPYTEAAWKEAIRWRPFIPVGELIVTSLFLWVLILCRCASRQRPG
jgi:cytochrome P450